MGTANWIKTLPNPITSRKDTFRIDYYHDLPKPKGDVQIFRPI